MKIVKLPLDSYEIQVWNHGIGYKNDSLDGERDSNGFLHTQTGLFLWYNYKITHVYYGVNYIWVIFKIVDYENRTFKWLR
jgi:hypothetical protein